MHRRHEYVEPISSKNCMVFNQSHGKHMFYAFHFSSHCVIDRHNVTYFDSVTTLSFCYELVTVALINVWFANELNDVSYEWHIQINNHFILRFVCTQIFLGPVQLKIFHILLSNNSMVKQHVNTLINSKQQKTVIHFVK